MAGVDAYGTLGLAGPIVPPLPPDAAPRSPRWPVVLRRFLAANPACAGCGRRADTGHHVVPFHVDPARELDPTNLVAVCVPCHYVLGHLGDWRLVNPGCRADLAAHRKRVQQAVAAGV